MNPGTRVGNNVSGTRSCGIAISGRGVGSSFSLVGGVGVGVGAPGVGAGTGAGCAGPGCVGVGGWAAGVPGTASTATAATTASHRTRHIRNHYHKTASVETRKYRSVQRSFASCQPRADGDAGTILSG